jgi:tetratricopeptide (TPR) repeat protein
MQGGIRRDPHLSGLKSPRPPRPCFSRAHFQMENRFYFHPFEGCVRWFRSPGCRLVAMSLAALSLAGCETVPERPPIHYTGDPLVDGRAELAVAPEKDRVLWDYRVAGTALREGKYDEAKARLDDAIARIGGLISNDEAAKKARSLFSGESEKVYIGEPYERVMCYYYRGLLYWRDGEPDNARACFRSGQYIDSDAGNDAYKADYVLLEYLSGLASVKLHDDGEDAFVRAQKLTKLTLQPYDPAANVNFFVEWGHGPQKKASGRYGEQLRFVTQPSIVRSAVLTVAGQEVSFLPWDDLDFQATTRGGRVMDYILGRKAVFKSTANTVGDVALVGAAVAADNIYSEKPRSNAPGNRQQPPDYDKSEGAEDAALALGVVGIVSKIAAAATTPKADTRTWNNLPQYLSFGSLRLPPGQYPARLDFLDAQGRSLATLSRTTMVTVGDPSHDTVVILSELKQ